MTAVKVTPNRNPFGAADVIDLSRKSPEVIAARLGADAPEAEVEAKPKRKPRATKPKEA